MDSSRGCHATEQEDQKKDHSGPWNLEASMADRRELGNVTTRAEWKLGFRKYGTTPH